VSVKILLDDQECILKLMPRLGDFEVTKKLEQTMRINLAGRHSTQVLNGLGDRRKYQEGDLVMMFKNSEERNEEIRSPRTTARLTSEPPAEPTKAKRGKDKPKVQKDWIQELIRERNEDHVYDAHGVWRLIETDKVIQVAIGGGSNLNPDPASTLDFSVRTASGFGERPDG
jgi:hypothetical protein